MNSFWTADVSKTAHLKRVLILEGSMTTRKAMNAIIDREDRTIIEADDADAAVAMIKHGLKAQEFGGAGFAAIVIGPSFLHSAGLRLTDTIHVLKFAGAVFFVVEADSNRDYLAMLDTSKIDCILTFPFKMVDFNDALEGKRF